MKHLTHIQVNQYVDNELPSHLRKEADGHLFECGQCSELIQSLQSLDTFLHNEFPIEHVSPNFASRVMSAVTQKPLISFVWKPLALFAFVLFVNALMVFQSGSPTELTAQPQSLHLVDLVKKLCFLWGTLFFPRHRKVFFVHQRRVSNEFISCIHFRWDLVRSR